MTLRWRKGMSLGEFEAMIEAHRREEGEKLSDVSDVLCVHPFDRLVTTIKAQRLKSGTVIVGVRMIVDYTCGECGAFLGHERKRVRM